MSVKAIETSDAGSQYRCGRVGRGVLPQFTPQPLPHSNMQEKYLKRSFPHFLTRSLSTDGRMDGRMDGRTDGQTDGRTDGRTKPPVELRVRNKKEKVRATSRRWLR